MHLHRESRWLEVGRDLRNACGNSILKLLGVNVEWSALSSFVSNSDTCTGAMGYLRLRSAQKLFETSEPSHEEKIA